MNNKQHIFSFFGKANQLLRKKHLLLIVPLCLGFLLTACEREESKKSDLGQVQLLRPVNGLAIKLENEAFSVQYHGFATSSNVAISINDVPCNTQVGSICRLTHNRAYGAASASLASLGGVLLLGENTVTVKNTANGAQEVLDFYYDNHKPSIEITEIEVVNDTNNDDELNAGDIVTITGKIIDPSPIKTVYLYKAGQVAPIYFANSYTNQGEMADKVFTIPSIAWPDANDPLPHFSYKITDIYDQVGEGKFLVNGAKVNNSQAIQLNNTLFQHVAPIGNKLIETMLSGLDDLYASPACAYDFDNDPQAYTCNPMRYAEDTLSKMFNDYAIAASFCSILRGNNPNAWPGCVGKIRDVGATNKPNILITKPKVMIGGSESSTFDLFVGVAFNAVELPFEITSTNGDRFTSTLELTSFQLSSNIQIKAPTAPGELVKIVRSPVTLNLSPKLGGNSQAYLRGSWCTGECGLSSVLLEAAYNLRLTKDGKKAADDMLTIFTNTIEDKLVAPLLPANTTVTLSDTSANPAIQQINKVYNRQAHWLDKAPRNLHLNYAGRNNAPTPINTLDNTIAKPILGALFTAKNNYAPVKDAVFPSKQAGVDGKLIDVAFAVSEDSANQQLAALYQSGQPGFLGGGIGRNVTAASTTFFNGLTTVCLESQANAAPSVDFIGYYSKKTGFSIDFTGLELINTNKDDIPGSIRLNMNNVSLTAKDGSCAGQPISNAQNINVDIAVRLFVYMENGKPVMKAYDRADDSFVIVRAINAEDSVIAAEFSKVLKEHVQQEMDKFNSDKVESIAMMDMPFLSPIVGSQLIFIYLSPDWWAGYGIKFMTFGIEPSGGYFTFTARVEVLVGEDNPIDTSTFCNANMADYFRAYCVSK